MILLINLSLNLPKVVDVGLDPMDVQATKRSTMMGTLHGHRHVDHL
jgi:hypothetical protein